MALISKIGQNSKTDVGDKIIYSNGFTLNLARKSIEFLANGIIQSVPLIDLIIPGVAPVVQPITRDTAVVFADAVSSANFFFSIANASASLLADGVLRLVNSPNVLFEDFINSTTGVTITLTYSGASGGTNPSEIPETIQSWNGSTAIMRMGASSVRINTANNSRSSLYSGTNYRCHSTAGFGFGADIGFTGGQVDFTNDPTLMAWGFLDNFNTNTPTNGFFFRPPRLGESNFLKAVIRVAGSDANFDTTINYDSAHRRYVSGYVEFNGVKNSVIFTASDGATTSTITIADFLTTYPTFSALQLGYGVANIRNGNPNAGVARNMNVDKILQYIKNNYYYGS